MGCLPDSCAATDWHQVHLSRRVLSALPRGMNHLFDNARIGMR